MEQLGKQNYITVMQYVKKRKTTLMPLYNIMICKNPNYI